MTLRTNLLEDGLQLELSPLKPSRVVALGHQAHWLLKLHLPEAHRILGRMWHFAYVANEIRPCTVPCCRKFAQVTNKKGILPCAC